MESLRKAKEKKTITNQSLETKIRSGSSPHETTESGSKKDWFRIQTDWFMSDILYPSNQIKNIIADFFTRSDPVPTKHTDTDQKKCRLYLWGR